MNADCSPWRYGSSWRALIFLGTAARDASVRQTGLSYEPIKRKNPRPFRPIRVVRVQPSVSVASPSPTLLWDGDIEALARMLHISRFSGTPGLVNCLVGNELASQ
jgi:hypothetical protein